MNAVLIIDKPSGLTSHDVVHRVRRILGQRDVGHLGTLDPMATGVPPLVLGNMTRLAQFYLKSDKRYEGTIRLGVQTETHDAAGAEGRSGQSGPSMSRWTGCAGLPSGSPGRSSRRRRHSPPRRSRACPHT